MNDSDCVFCKIVKNEAPAHVVWEDDKHIAFLSIFPNTEGFTVVTTKKHYSSDHFGLPNEVLVDLVLAAKKVAKKIEAAFEDVGRIGLIAEGMMIDHIHLKLFPMHGTKSEKWKQWISNVDKYFDKYEGYISSHNYKREDDIKLKVIAEKIKNIE